MRYSIMCPSTLWMLLRKSGKSTPGASGCRHRSFSLGALCLLQMPVSFHRLMFPVPRRGIRHWFNAIETFITNRLIRDALTFFGFGAPVGWRRSYLFARGCGDDGNAQPARAEKGKVIKFLYWLSKYSVLSLEVLLVQVCQEPSVLRVSNVLMRAAKCPAAPFLLRLCIQHPTQLRVESKMIIKIKGLLSMIQPQRAYAAACKADGKDRKAAAKLQRAGLMDPVPQRQGKMLLRLEMASWQGPAAERSLGR